MKQVEELHDALNGKIRMYHRQLLKIHLAPIIFIVLQIREVEDHIEKNGGCLVIISPNIGIPKKTKESKKQPIGLFLFLLK